MSRRRVRFVTGRVVPARDPRRVRCSCGKELQRDAKGKIPAHKDRKTGEWCKRRGAPRKTATTPKKATASQRPSSVAPARKPALKDGASHPRAGQIQCKKCLRWFEARGGNLPAHRDRLDRRACVGSPDAERAARSQLSKKMASDARTRQDVVTNRPQAQVGWQA